MAAVITFTWHITTVPPTNLIKVVNENISWRADCKAISNQADAYLLDPTADLTSRCAWRGRKQWSTGCTDARTWTSTGTMPSVVLHPHSESSRSAPTRCWRSIGPPYRPICTIWVDPLRSLQACSLCVWLCFRGYTFSFRVLQGPGRGRRNDEHENTTLVLAWIS